MKRDGLIQMKNGDPDNLIQSILQVFLEIDDLKKYFILETIDNSELFKAIQSIFHLTFKDSENAVKLIKIEK